MGPARCSKIKPVVGAPMTKSGLYLDPNQAFKFLSGVKNQLFGASSPTTETEEHKKTDCEKSWREQRECDDEQRNDPSPTPSSVTSMRHSSSSASLVNMAGRIYFSFSNRFRLMILHI